jgi:hypothetical protein
MIVSKRVLASSYIRSFDRRIMIQIEEGCFVALRSARRLRLIPRWRQRREADV